MPSESAIDPIEVRLFLEAIMLRHGYDLRHYSTATMTRRVRSLLLRSGAAHLGELQHRVLVEPSFINEVLDALTVQVSEMFRDPSFYRALRSRVIPVLRSYPLLRIWNAGCASGEEAYSCAILLDEAGLYERAQIYATDISARAIELAQQGIYPAERTACFEDNYRAAGGDLPFEHYCVPAYDCIALRASLRKHLLFFQHNLVSDHTFGEMQLVFCRNVLLYFNPELRVRVMKTLVDSLAPRGFLCLGKSERLPAPVAVQFEEFDAAEAIYRRVN